MPNTQHINNKDSDITPSDMDAKLTQIDAKIYTKTNHLKDKLTEIFTTQIQIFWKCLPHHSLWTRKASIFLKYGYCPPNKLSHQYEESILSISIPSFVPIPNNTDPMWTLKH